MTGSKLSFNDSLSGSDPEVELFFFLPPFFDIFRSRTVFLVDLNCGVSKLTSTRKDCDVFDKEGDKERLFD